MRRWLWRLRRSTVRGYVTAGLSLVAGMMVCTPVRTVGQEAPRTRLGAGLSGDLLVGDASDFLDGGTGRFLMADFRLDRRDRFQLRVDLGWSSMVDDDDEPSGARAENDLFTLLAGPQLTGQLGKFRPYAAGLAGLLGVAWRTEERGGRDESDGEGGLAFGAHAGLGVLLDAGDHPIVIQLEGRLLQAGEYAFARAPAPDNVGSPVGLIRSDFGVLSLRIAVTLGF